MTRPWLAARLVFFFVLQPSSGSAAVYDVDKMPMSELLLPLLSLLICDDDGSSIPRSVKLPSNAVLTSSCRNTGIGILLILAVSSLQT